MSYRVLIVPEDPTHDHFILEPLVSRILRECGRPNAKVTTLSNPKVSGYEHARDQMSDIIDLYSHWQLLVFLVDANGSDRAHAFKRLEEIAAEQGVRLICCAAVCEVEVWLLAGHVSKLDRPWNEVRADTSVKENVFVPFLEHYGDARRPGGGRDLLMQETLSNYQGLLQRCPELEELQRRICEASRLLPAE